MGTTPTLTHTDTTPIFVYGTLRPDCGNDVLWRGKAHARFDGLAILPRFRLVSGGAFPFALPDADADAVGALIVPNDGEYDEVLARMDRLEGYPRFYDRLMVAVDTPDGIVKAWVYTPAHPDEYDHLADVPDGDWHNVSRRWRS